MQRMGPVKVVFFAYLRGRSLAKSRFAGQHLVQHLPRIGLLRDRNGWIIGTGGFHPAQLGQSEIQNLDALVLRHEDAFRLESAVNDAGIVCRAQSRRNCEPEIQRARKCYFCLP